MMTLLNLLALFGIFSLLLFMFLAFLDFSFGARQTYVRILLKIFEFACKSKQTPNFKGGGGDASESTMNLSKKCETDVNGRVCKSPKIIKHSNGLGHQPVNIDSQNCQTMVEYNVNLCLEYVTKGMEAIIEDEVTSCFLAEELKNWNFLTRTYRNYEFTSFKITIIWLIGCIFRHCVLFPLRMICLFLGVFWLLCGTFFISYLKEGQLKRKIVCFCLRKICGFFSLAMSSVIEYHDKENRPVKGICVANHTSPIDVLVLLYDNMYSLIGQRHGGFLGIWQKALVRASPHIWFERSESKERQLVLELLKKHVSDDKNPPILIFPEGTCINNTSVMQFKKGSFEVGSVIYPVAIKYDPRFGDTFWNSSKFSMIHYIYLMMTSWAIVCNVWYLPPMYRNPGETAIEFANRVKSVIAKKGGLVDLAWDGQLKRMMAKKEWKEEVQKEITKKLKHVSINVK